MEHDNGLVVLDTMASSSDDNSRPSVSHNETVALAVKRPVFYLAHPFKKRDEVRSLYQPRLTAIVDVVNPFDRPEQSTYDDALAGQGLTAKMCREIVETDLSAIDHTDGLLALLLADNSIGTFMEIMYVVEQNQRGRKPSPIFAYTPRSNEREHPWIRSLTTVCPTWISLEANIMAWCNAQRQP